MDKLKKSDFKILNQLNLGLHLEPHEVKRAGEILPRISEELKKREPQKNVVSEKDLTDAGFEKTGMPMFPYAYSLFSKKEVSVLKTNNLEVPQLLFGDTGVNKGFIFYSGYYFIALNCITAKEAVAFTKNLRAFEPV